MSNSIMATYGRLPVQFTHGEGAILWDESGKAYLDALSGIAVCSLGHAHPAVTKAICEQASQLVHTSNLYGIQRQQKLADSLVDLSGMEQVFFSNSGAEANEAAIKLARKYGHAKGYTDAKIIVMHQSFHGRTLATLSATGNPKVHAGFAPLVSGFIRVTDGDLEAVKKAAEVNDDIVAILVEPVQGEGGVNIPPSDYLPGLRELCDQHDWLLMLDEIQTGIGRTGKMFAFQHYDLVPDVMTLAKALGNGVPIGACMVAKRASGVLQAGNHGSTFGGNPLSCAAAQAVLDTMQADGVVENAAIMGQSIRQGFEQALVYESGILNIRHLGMMIGITLNTNCTVLVVKALEAGFLINVTAESTIRLLPPLNFTQEQADQLVNGLSIIIKTFLKEQSHD